jgi:parvulin-like peptidyl-prolyl isomerase
MNKFWIACSLSLLFQMNVSAQLMASHGSASVAKQNGTAAQFTGKPVARVNGAILTDRDLLLKEYQIFPYAQQHGGSIPREMEPEIRSGALQMLIFDELLYQEALRRKMTVPSAQLEKARAEFRQLFATQDEYQKALALDFQSSEQVLHEKIRRSMLIEAILKTDVQRKAALSPLELRAYYAKNPARFLYPDSFAIQTISFIAPEKATPPQLQEARRRAAAALPQAQAAKNYNEFGLLAEKLSEDDFRVKMGDHKAVPRAKIAPQVVQALMALKPGQVTGVLQVDQIFTIVRLIQHIPAGKMKFEEVQVPLKAELEKKKLNEVRSTLNKRLHQTAKVEVL